MEKSNKPTSLIILLAIIFILTQSCVYVERKFSRKELSYLRFDGKVGKAKNVFTDGIYVDINRKKSPILSIGGLNYSVDSEPSRNRISGIKFFDDGTVLSIILEGEGTDSVKSQLENFTINKITITHVGLFSISDCGLIYREKYTQNDIQLIKHLFPYELFVDSFMIVNDTTLFHYQRGGKELDDSYIFVPCDIPITSHHPFKSKRWLWTDKKARKQYMREWKEVKKERKRSKIKYNYE